MRRWTLIGLLIGLFALPWVAMTVFAQQPGIAQQPPLPFLTPQAPPDGEGSTPPSGLPFPLPGQNNQNNQPPADVVPPPVEADTPAEPAEEPAAEEAVETVETVDAAQTLAVTIRTDLEILADVLLGGNSRPEGWNGATDPGNPQFGVLTRLDLELLAGTVLGANTRPDGWFGVVASTPYAVIRDVRHDLELLADNTVGERPGGWLGGTPMMRCPRTTQTLVEFLERNGVFVLQADPTAPDFCLQADIQAGTFMEVNVLTSPDAGSSLIVRGLGANAGSASINSPFAAAFLDRSASRRVGVIPEETPIDAVGKSPAQFSNMMLVEGNGFLVYVDYQFTSVTEDQFDDLPDVNEAELSPFCSAEWCTES